MKPAEHPRLVARRRLLRLSALAVPGAVQTSRAAWADEGPPGAVALDGFTTFDPRPVFALAESIFPGRGAELGNAWRTRQFEYTWLRTLSNRYADFWQVTEEALVYSAQLLKLDLTSPARARLMNAYLELQAWPDAVPALRRLRDAGVRLAFLSNFTEAMLQAATRNAQLGDLLETPLSTDRVRAFKPDPRAYAMGVSHFGLPRTRIVFAAFGGWDAAGAHAFGYPTFWVNRLGLPLEALGEQPDGTGSTLGALADFVLARRSGAQAA